MTEYEMPETACPYCGHHFDRASNAYDNDKPEAGDVTFCIRCAKILVFTKDLTVRKPTVEELMKFNRDPRVTRVQIAIADVVGRMEGKNE